MRISELKERLDQLEGRERKLYETSLFLSKMILAGLLFHLVLHLHPDTYSIQAGVAHLTQSLLEITGVQLERQGALLVDAEKAYLVTQDCLGWKSMAAYSALIFASTSEYRRHIKPLAVGLIAIAAVNLFRISTTVYLSHTGLVSFEIVHSLFWKWGLTFTVLFIWISWLHRYRQKARS